MTAKIHKLSCPAMWSLLVFMLVFPSQWSLASKGGIGGDKDKKGYVLKVNGFEVKKSYASPLSLMRQGATYKSTISPMMQGGVVNSPNHSIITYQKGNTIYIYPVQQKGILQKFKTPSKSDIKY